MNLDYQSQHKKRLSFMPWLYYSLKEKHLAWAKPWQDAIQKKLMAMETVSIGKNCFISPDANIFAEPNRHIVIGDNSYIGANTVIHGPMVIGSNVAINHNGNFDGGKKGIHIGDHCRIAAHCSMVAFNHGMEADVWIHDQPVTSKGIVLGRDVWVGANVGIVDGATIGDGCIVGMNSVVTKTFEKNRKLAGNPARVIGKR